MFANSKADIIKHIKTHSERSSEDVAAVNLLSVFLRSNGKLNPSFSSNDKWPNTDGVLELVSNPDLSRQPEQSFVVQIKGTINYKETDNGDIKYSLKNLAFPAYVANEVTLNPGLLFVVLNPETRGKERVFCKYISSLFLSNIDFKKNSTVLTFSKDEEILNNEDSVDEFIKKLIYISENHLFTKQLSKREFSKQDVLKVIKVRSNNVCCEIEKGRVLNETRENVSKRIITELKDLCVAALLLNGLRYTSLINLRTSWEIALTDINTKFLSSFFQGLKYIDIRVPEDGQNERLLLKYYSFLWKMRCFMQTYYNESILENLERFPLDKNDEDEEYNKLVAASIETVCLSFNPWRTNKYYVKKKTAFFVNKERYFEITLQLAGKYATKYNRLTVYSKIDISSYYPIQIGFEEVNIKLWDEVPSKIKVVTNWKVSIHPYVLNKLSHIIGVSKSISSQYQEYVALMDFLTKTGISIIDFIDFSDLRFNDLIERIYSNTNTDYFKETLIILHNNYNSKSEKYGRNTIRYFLQSMREETVENIYSFERRNGLCLSRSCYPFELNPLLYNLPNQKTNSNTVNRDVLRAIGLEKTKNYLPYLRIKQMINSTGEIVFKENTIINNTDELNNYNSMLSQWDIKQGVDIREEDGFIYLNSYVNDTLSILKTLMGFAEYGNDGQIQLNNRFIKKTNPITMDRCKEVAIKNAFVKSSVIMIYGAAGTGKTTLMDYLSSLMAGRSKLFLTKTHTALENLRRRINAPGQNSVFSGIDRIVRSNNPINYDLVFVDECSTIDNRTMVRLLNKINDNTLLVLAGDIYQIESIDFGNWFFYAKDILPSKAVVELNSTWRTEDENIKSLWEEVRFKKQLITEKLVIDGPFSENINKSIFQRNNDDEVVLCLNYDGKFGLNSVNGYFQDANPSKEVFTWQEWKYKVGDPVLFNESKRFPLLYNNLKGWIIEIKKGTDRIEFTIDVALLLTAVDAKDCEFEIISVSEDKTRIKFSIYLYDDTQSDDENEVARMRSVIPFQLAYAVSIHKAQGLEYDSIKIIIPSSNSERITHGVFYTAITRAKKCIKIYWSSDTMRKVLKGFENIDSERYSLKYIKKALEDK